MKKFFKTISVFMVVIFLICLASKLDILDFFVLNISEEELASYNEYYFNQLEQDEKEIYVRIDNAVKNMKKKILIGTYDTTHLTQKVSKVLTAYFYDNPEYYWVSNQYVISTKNFKLFEYSTVELDYLIEDKQIEVRDNYLEKVIDNIIKDNITDKMTDFEKEVAIHDALVERVSYYEYEDINNIPWIKHTAYGALVEREAVCDGYAKAFKMLLDEVGIESIIINGMTYNVLHAWNMVELNEEYYHVDVTSDKLEDNNEKNIIHTYFNVTDEAISKTHTIGKMFKYPESTSTEYNYYIKKDYYINYEDNIYNKLKDIILKQSNSAVLEVRLDERCVVRNIIDTLYELNFNNWRSSGKTSVSYSNIEDIYVFQK